jgi:hypothetical protein
MASHTTRISGRQQLVDYCLRRLGAPVIEINVDGSQIEDRLDDALQLFSEFHFDGVERVFLKYQMTQEDINNGYIVMKSTNSGFRSADRNIAATEEGVTENVPMEDLITSVVRVFQLRNTSIGMFDIRYQYALNELYSFGTFDLQHYSMIQQYLSLLSDILTPEKELEFSRVTNKLTFPMTLRQEFNPGDYLVIECFRVLDPRIYPEIYSDRLLKRYMTALIKRQWGENLSKFEGVTLPGGVTFNGRRMIDEAQTEIDKIEEQIINEFELPPNFMVG